MKIHNVDQGTDEWHELRKGKLTASNAQAIQANGKGLKTYVEKIILSMRPDYDREERYYGADMERGHDLEASAIAKYEFERQVEVTEVGFVEVSERCGASPDGLVREKGGIEVKARNDQRHFKLLLGGKMEKKAWWQIQMNLWATGREWWDFISYNPNFKNSLHVRRILPDQAAFQKIRKGVHEGAKMIDRYLKEDIIKEEIK